MLIFTVIFMGLGAGILVGLLGIGGGIVLVPAMVYLLHYDQHLAQGTSLFILLPPIGLGALRQYWTTGNVDLRAGLYCVIGFLFGGWIGGRLAVPMPSWELKAIFGFFMIISAILLWRKKTSSSDDTPANSSSSLARAIGIVFIAGIAGFASGMVGIGGGTVLVPLLALFFGFSQHRAQGTSLVALIPPTGILAFLAYAKAGYVNWETGLLLIPGVFLGGILGAMIARRLNPLRMRQVFAALLFLLGASQAISAWRH
jgi:uncharacterized membrane protein YfcA